MLYGDYPYEVHGTKNLGIPKLLENLVLTTTNITQRLVF